MATSGEEMDDFAYGIFAKIKAGRAASVPKRDINKTTVFFDDAGDRLVQDGQFGPGAAFLQIALTCCTENANVYGHTEAGRKQASDLINRIGVCYYALNVWDKAAFHFELAYNTDPDNVRAAHNWVQVMLAVFAIHEAIVITESVLRRRPKTSMHEEFEQLHHQLTTGVTAAKTLLQQHFGLDENGVPIPAGVGIDRGLEDSPSPKESEGACASPTEVEGAAAAEPRRRSRKKTRSRSRSTSESSKHRDKYPLAMPPKKSKKEQERLDRMRQKDIEMNIHKPLVEKMKQQQEKEEAKRIRKESEGEKTSQFELVPDLRHVVPGGMQKTKAESRKERSAVKQSSPKQTAEEEGGKPKETTAKKKTEEKKG